MKLETIFKNNEKWVKEKANLAKEFEEIREIYDLKPLES